MFKNELEIDVFRCLKALLKNWKFIAIITVAFFVIGFGLTLDIGNDKYGARSTVYASADNSYSEATSAASAMNAYMDVAKSYKVCQRAALILGRSDIEATDIQRCVSVSSSADTSTTASALARVNSASIITFTATTVDKNLSMEMADAMAQAYTIEMANILHSDTVKVLDSAYNYYTAYNAVRSAWKDRIRLTLAGLFLSCLAIVILDIADRRVRTVREATIGGKLPIIGVIPDYKD